MKKVSFLRIVLFLCLFSGSFLLSAQGKNEIQQFTLENGLSVFLLEDPSDALVRVEFTCRAGFSYQDQNNAGFFKLYSRLFKDASSRLTFTDVQCNADSSRYILSTPPAGLTQLLETLSESAFSLFYTDELLALELEQMKEEVTQTAQSPAGFINSAIDSRVFAQAPWKHDSGIYPALFSKTSNKQARTILKEIADKWYTPQNSALFISGNINSERLTVIIKNTFGRYYSSYRRPDTGKLQAETKQETRKFVLHNPEFSPELTQVVVQYTYLAMNQADLLAATLNQPDSKFKNAVLDLPQLNIPGDEYINVSGAHKQNSNRLIFQTLMQPPEQSGNKKNKVTSCQQSEAFVNQVQNAIFTIDTKSLQAADNLLTWQRKAINANASSTMDYAALQWAIEPFVTTGATDLAALSKTYTSENPFVFVIINSDDYRKNKKEYDAGGYREVTAENGSWYVQEMFREIRDQFKPEEKTLYNFQDLNAVDNNYYYKNIAQIEKTTLKNGIPVITKKNDFSDFVTIGLSIKGGKLYSKTNNGFEDAMVYLISMLIQKEIGLKQSQGLILGAPTVTSKTDLVTSTIFIECEKEDFVSVCNAISTAIIFGEVKPAQADRAVSSRQYKKRLENGSAVNQMQAVALTTILGKSHFAALFNTQNDILQNTTYNSILAAYPQFLDCTRYSVILCGNFYQDYVEVLNSTLGMLGRNNFKFNSGVPETKFPKNKRQLVKIQHTFLTDIPAEQAGPMPAVLIPTTEFLDPVMYVIKSPSPTQEQKSYALFNALINYLQHQLQKEINTNEKLSGATVSVTLPRYGIPAAFVTLQNVSSTVQADAVYETTIKYIKQRINALDANQTIIQDIKDNWIQDQMYKTQSNTGTADLMQKGFELYPDSLEPEYYLTEYDYIQKATFQDFRNILDFIPEKPDLRLYSQEAKN